ncbi:hypothetical protein EOD41_15070 [Mucilaginibacter limnophilus]|uniref:Uncharacterized protein n=1 Tax=Mucilaginibacter limnophilus TaxID=1932778 RepID=A0A437MQ49_9SPHI|nr:hypothetical protein [Mucilaginibacter limnophilus]RVT99764.1 hypothetical protein EOD41_15070 [Mucilaginibacter limnophilus]
MNAKSELPELAALYKKREEHQAIIAALDAEIRVLEDKQKKPVDWKNRAIDCLQTHNLPLRTLNILDYIVSNEPQLNTADPYKRRFQFQAVYATLNGQCEHGTLKRIAIPGFKGYFYGLNTWFNKDGKLKAAINQKLQYELWSNPHSIFKAGK